MDCAKLLREKLVKMSRNKRESTEVQSTGVEDMAVACNISVRTGSQDSNVTNRLTFRADPDLLEPTEKQRKKLSRNEIEKLRRDRLNAYFMELAKLVPLVMQSSKKIDKASILRLTVAYLRIYHDLVKGSKKSKLSGNWRPDVAMCENLGNLLLESVGGFLLVISKNGILIFATDAITKHFGHSLSDVLGSEVKNIIHPNDYEILQKQFEITENDHQIKDTDDESDTAHIPVSGQRSFCVKMLNVLDPQSTYYEIVHLVGHLKKMPPASKDNPIDNLSGVHPPGPATKEPSVCLIVVAKLISRQPIQELYPVLNSNSDQWITRHEMDGKITYSDQRGALLTGFLPGESIGFSAYSLLHPDDIASVVSVHNLFLTAGSVPQTTFRMFTKSREILYIQTNTHMVVDMWTSKAKFIISINNVLDEELGNRALEDQRRRIEATRDICNSNLLLSGSDDSSSADFSLPSCCSSQDPESMSAAPLIGRDECIIPKVEEVDDATVNVVVGPKKFQINLSENEKFDPKNLPQDLSGISMVFDTHASEDDGGRFIPSVIPSFVNGYCSGSVGRRSTASDDDLEMCTPLALISKHNDRNNTIEPTMLRETRFDLPGDSEGHSEADNNGFTLARLLQKNDRTRSETITNVTEGLKKSHVDKQQHHHLLLRKLLVDKSHVGMQLKSSQGPDVGNGLVSPEVKQRDEPKSKEFSQIKVLLQERSDGSKKSSTLKRQNPRIQNGARLNSRRPNRNWSCHLSTTFTAPSAALSSPPSAALSSPPVIAASNGSAGLTSEYRLPNETCTSDEDMVWSECFSFATSPNGNNNFVDERIALNSTDSQKSLNGGDQVNMSYEELDQNFEEFWTPAPEKTQVNVSYMETFSGQGQQQLPDALPATDSERNGDDAQVMRSSVMNILSGLSSSDKLEFLRHIMGDEPTLYTIDTSADNGGANFPTPFNSQFVSNPDTWPSSNPLSTSDCMPDGGATEFQPKQTCLLELNEFFNSPGGNASWNEFQVGSQHASECAMDDNGLKNASLLAHPNDISGWSYLPDDF